MDHRPHFEKQRVLVSEQGIREGKKKSVKRVNKQTKGEKEGKESKTVLCLLVCNQPVMKGFDSECSGKKKKN